MKQELIEAVKAKALEFGEFILKSGQKSNFYLDVKKLALSGWLHVVIENLRAALDGLVFDAIGGPCVGADPIVGGYLALHGERELNGFLVRPEEKDHGKKDRIIGSIQKGDRCVVIEDVATTGGSLLSACAELELWGATVVQAVVVVDRLQGAGEAFKKAGIPFKSLVTIQDILPDLKIS